MISYSRQYIDKNDIGAVIKALKSDYLTSGPLVPKFEKKISDKVSSKFAVAVNSATSALHISCMALGLKKGDILWTSANSFVASANCGLYCGAKVDFVDIDKNLNIDLNLLEKKLLKAKKNKALPKILVPVHFSGQSCDMKIIKKLSKKYKFKIIEDASHAFGGKYLKKPVGCCDYSDITVFSFHPVKIITTIEGGVAVTNKKDLYSKLKALRNHGITKNNYKFNNYKYIRSHYEQKYLGFNYRMNDVQAALGISQIKKLKMFVSIRQKIRKFYDTNLNYPKIVLPKESKFTYSTYHLYIIRVKKKFRDKLLKLLKSKKIFSTIHYIPIHYHQYYKKLGFKKGDFPNAEKYYEECISLPIHPKLKLNQLKYIVKNIKYFFEKNK